MTLPSYYFLTEKYGAKSVFWCCDVSLVSFLKIFVPIDNIIAYDFKKLHGSLTEKISISLSINFLVLQRKWEKIYFFHADFRYKFMYFLGHKKVINYSYKIARRQNFIHGRYSGINFFSMVSNIDGPGLTIFDNYFQKTKLVISELVDSHQSKNIPKFIHEKPYILICPSLSGNPGDQSAKLRRLPIPKWQAIISSAREKGYKVVAVGSSDESNVIDGELPEVINLCGKTTFQDLFYLIQSAKYVIATDNGIMHCAYLTTTKIAAIFGPTPPTERIPPNCDSISFNKIALNCSPCFDGRLTASCDSHDCLNSLDVTKITDML